MKKNFLLYTNFKALCLRLLSNILHYLMFCSAQGWGNEWSTASLFLQSIACSGQIDQKNIDQALDHMMIIAVMQVYRNMEFMKQWTDSVSYT